MNNRNQFIDLCKYIAALLVIGIHTAIFSDVHKGLHFLVVEIICRIAVPFFAMCTGYFFYKKPMILKQEKKLVALYGIWSMVYLVFSIPSWITSGWFGVGAFIDYGIATVLRGSYYHLWYLLSVIYALPLLYICIKKINQRYHALIAIVLYAMKVFMYGYRTWMPITIQELLTVLDKFSGITDAVFCILPFMLLGTCICRKETEVSLCTWIGMFASILALVIEAGLLKNAGQTGVSYILFTFSTAFCLFQLVISAKVKTMPFNSKRLGSISLMIYCLHPIILETMDTFMLNSIVLFITTATLSTIFALLFIFIKEKVVDARQRGKKYV